MVKLYTWWHGHNNSLSSHMENTCFLNLKLSSVFQFILYVIRLKGKNSSMNATQDRCPFPGPLSSNFEPFYKMWGEKQSRFFSAPIPPSPLLYASPNWSHCSGLGRLAKKWELFPPTFHLSYSNQPKRFVIQMNTGNINKTTVGSHNWQNLNFISWNKTISVLGW